MDSTNGCYVNGRRVTRQLLKDGDTLQLGAVPLRFGCRATQD
jgi:pSer/pThr/pTyr-binding forkhead associated (FHA) protein